MGTKWLSKHYSKSSFYELFGETCKKRICPIVHFGFRHSFFSLSIYTSKFAVNVYGIYELAEYIHVWAINFIYYLLVTVVSVIKICILCKIYETGWFLLARANHFITFKGDSSWYSLFLEGSWISYETFDRIRSTLYGSQLWSKQTSQPADVWFQVTLVSMDNNICIVSFPFSRCPLAIGYFLHEVMRWTCTEIRYHFRFHRIKCEMMSLHYNLISNKTLEIFMACYLKLCMCMDSFLSPPLSLLLSVNYWKQVLWFAACTNENCKCSWFSVLMPQWIHLQKFA